MKIIKSGILAVLIFTGSLLHSMAIEGLTLSLQCTNVVLRWPSVEGETYIVQHRATLNTNDTWQTLTNFYPAFTGTNRTTFVHSNQVTCIQNNFSGGGGTGGGPPSPSSTTVQASSDESGAMKKENKEKELPPLPWDQSTWATSSTTSATTFSAESNGPESATGGGGMEMGFYRVVRNSVSLFGLTNGTTFQGVITIPIELSATNEGLNGISFYANGAPSANAMVATNSNGNWELQWDTTAVVNGTYTIHLAADFDSEILTGLSNTVTVNNLISFPYFAFNQFFNTQLWIDAELSVQAADYVIDIYDDQENYIGYFDGSTTDGVISFIWDFSAETPPFTNDGFRLEYFITPSGSASARSSAAAKKFYSREANWNPTGFVIGFGAVDGNGTTTGKIDDMVRDGVVNTLAGTYTLSGGNTVNSHAFQLLPNSMNTFTNALKDFRNFYWFGHGSATTFSPFDTNARLTFLRVQNLLKNFQNGTNFVNRHPYKFVFIDGCDNGAGDFCTAFGIPAQTVHNGFFYASQLRSRAYLGFKKEITLNTSQTIQRASMLQGFFGDWIMQQPLHTCVSNATRLAVQPMPSSWVIYGATNLTIADF